MSWGKNPSKFGSVNHETNYVEAIHTATIPELTDIWQDHHKGYQPQRLAKEWRRDISEILSMIEIMTKAEKGYTSQSLIHKCHNSLNEQDKRFSPIYITQMCKVVTEQKKSTRFYRLGVTTIRDMLKTIVDTNSSKRQFMQLYEEFEPNTEELSQLWTFINSVKEMYDNGEPPLQQEVELMNEASEGFDKQVSRKDFIILRRVFREAVDDGDLASANMSHNPDKGDVALDGNWHDHAYNENMSSNFGALDHI